MNKHPFKSYNELRDDLFCKYCKKQCKSLNSLKSHESKCKENPNRKISNNLNHGSRKPVYDINGILPNRHIKPEELDEFLLKNPSYKIGYPPYYRERMKQIQIKIKNENCGRALTPEKEIERKLKISKSMKLAHKEGRAGEWLPPKSGYRSYAEQFFMKVIENEFDDKNVQTEYKLNKYWLDFAWVDKKLCIEIDGKQHTYKDNIEHDKIRDKYLESIGWKTLRISWDNLFHHTKEYIQIAKDFIHK